MMPRRLSLGRRCNCGWGYRRKENAFAARSRATSAKEGEEVVLPKKETGYHPGHLSRRCGEVVARSGHTKTEEELEEEKKFARVVFKVLRLQLGGFRQQVERERLALGR